MKKHLAGWYEMLRPFGIFGVLSGLILDKLVCCMVLCCVSFITVVFLQLFTTATNVKVCIGYQFVHIGAGQ